MADISKIKTPDGTTYDIKDSTARTQISGKANATHTHVPSNIQGGNDSMSGALDLITASKVGSASSNKSFGMPASAITIQYSRDGGSTWTDYGATDNEKRDLFNETRGTVFRLGKCTTASENSVNNQLRIIVEPIDRYCRLDSIFLWYGSSGNTAVMDLDRSTIGAKDTYTNVFTGQSLAGDTGNNIRYFSAGTFGGYTDQNSNNYKYRITLRQTAINSSRLSANVSDIRLFGPNWWKKPSGIAGNFIASDHAYTWDRDGNVTFPAKVSASSFNGYTIQSNVPSGAKFTDTTYSSGTGISVSGTTINHSNSVTAQTTQAVYPIKIDAQGHISAYGSAVTIPDISGKVDKINITAQNTQALYPIKINAQGQITAYGSAVTSMTPSSHSHGNITNAGDITATATIASGDRLVINDESASKVTNSSITFGTDTTTFLRNDGTWATAGGGTASTITENTEFNISGTSFYIELVS